MDWIKNKAKGPGSDFWMAKNQELAPRVRSSSDMPLKATPRLWLWKLKHVMFGCNLEVNT